MVWRTRSEEASSFIPPAGSPWEMVVTRQNGVATLTARGPETKARAAPIPEDAEFVGIRFKLGVFMPHLPHSALIDGGVILPDATQTSFWLHGSAWQCPDFDNADVFVKKLVREGLLVRDPLVDDVLHGRPTHQSPRSVQRRFLRAAGLTRGAVVQIDRAQQAAALLARGVSILDAVDGAGYADQPHLTRSLERLTGQTPAQLVRARQPDRSSDMVGQHGTLEGRGGCQGMTMSTDTTNAAIAATNHPFIYKRRVTRVVMVGDVAVGGDNPIRVQSMTTTLTSDVEATAAQAERLVKAGCEIVRITAPTPRDARALGDIKKLLAVRGIYVPLVADIHFNPESAMTAADYVEKVRINPGNYADSRKFAVREYTNTEYDAELERIEERVTPLILKLKERGVALRIGTNHGSLSDRITNRYGDTPRGMVESAMEFVRICEKNGYQDIILSMKASNPTVMIAAYRLLAAYMASENMAYPFHLGVTEAGNGEDGRIKSAVGIGALLLDGVGDTIRVSLTEEPEEEIPVAFALARMLPPHLLSEGGSYGVVGPTPPPSWDALSYRRRSTHTVQLGASLLGGAEPALVLAPAPSGAVGQPLSAPLTLPIAGAAPGAAPPPPRRGPRPDAVTLDIATADDLTHLRGLAWKGQGRARTAYVARGGDPALLVRALEDAEGAYLALDAHDDAGGIVAALIEKAGAQGKTLVVEAESVDVLLEAACMARDAAFAGLVLALRVEGALDTLQLYRLLASRLAQEDGLDFPLHLRYAGPDEGAMVSRVLIEASAALGALLCDGIGDMAGLQDETGRALVSLTFNLLQATGRRITKTDYVACPSCGRTLFDLQSTTEKIKEKTAHLVGVKIAIMGCVVNGPGEMADADFGYVGGAPGKVNLYVGKQTVERNVPEDEAADRLVDLIKARGRWAEKTDDDQDDESADAVH